MNTAPTIEGSVLRLGWLVLLGLLTVATAQAQLISPGKLSRTHQSLEGLRNCTSCHALGNKGVDRALCLDCHEPLRTRLDAGRGFHASLTEQDCGTCHKEHFGLDFDLVRFDTTRFDHEDTGFQLLGAHREVACRTCHQPANIAAADVRAFKGRHNALDRTFLGLGQPCLTCHEADSPHAGQFAGDDCATCHTETEWEAAPRFDHDEARFALTGRHREADCAGCHTQAEAPGGALYTRYEGLSFASCASCHQDAHQGAMQADCASCHVTAGWHQLKGQVESRFDHATTGFDLVGRHAELSCISCHERPARNDARIRIAFARGTAQHTYPGIVVEDCLSCHVDEHSGTFAETPGGAVCENCHTQDGWTPVTYDLERHNREAHFELTGAHLATPCSSCHLSGPGELRFTFDDLACESCHKADSPHGDEFDDEQGITTCATCHVTDEWRILGDFDHAATGFPLTGLHATVACSSCHTPRPPAPDGITPPRFRGLDTSCQSCHADDDPHHGQFDERACVDCHTTDGFTEASAAFDHDQTRFPLEGAHEQVACAQCHRRETAADGVLFVRYRPFGIACKDCHSDE